MFYGTLRVMEYLFPQDILAQSRFFEVNQDWEVPIEGFMIIAPLVRGKKSLDDFTNEERIDYVQFVSRVRSAMRSALGIAEVYFFQNEDSAYGFHLWMFPRHPWMERFGRKIQSVRPVMEHAKEHMADEKTIAAVKAAAEKIRTALAADKEPYAD